MSKTKDRAKAARARAKARKVEMSAGEVAPLFSIATDKKLSVDDLGVYDVVRILLPQDDPRRHGHCVGHYAVTWRVGDGEFRCIYGTSRRVPSEDAGLLPQEFSIRQSDGAAAIGLKGDGIYDARNVIDLPEKSLQEVRGLLPGAVRRRMLSAMWVGQNDFHIDYDAPMGTYRHR